jgi:16S rRNA (guanine966-N2)-methyltransferase
MRVIAGVAKGHQLLGPRGRGTRPTSDRLRGAIFDALGERAGYGRVLDLYAGTGALGIEALSRGAEQADFVESDRAMCAVIRANLERTRLADRGRVLCRRVEDVLPELTGPYDLILMDPPYDDPRRDEILATLATSSLISPDTLVVVEHAARRPPPDRIGRLVLWKRRRHGDGAFSIYIVAEPLVPETAHSSETAPASEPVPEAC